MEHIDWGQVAEAVGALIAAILIGLSYYSRWKMASKADKVMMEKELADRAIEVVVKHIEEGMKDGASAKNVKDAIKKSPIKTVAVEEYLHGFVKKLEKGG